jgi:hypothetical protein
VAETNSAGSSFHTSGRNSVGLSLHIGCNNKEVRLFTPSGMPILQQMEICISCLLLLLLYAKLWLVNQLPPSTFSRSSNSQSHIDKSLWNLWQQLLQCCWRPLEIDSPCPLDFQIAESVLVDSFLSGWILRTLLVEWTDISVSFVFNGKTFDIALVRFLLSGKDRDWCMDRYQAAPVTWNVISLHEKKATSSSKLSNLSAC